MRLFIAIGATEMNFDPKKELKKLRMNLNRKELEYRWVPQENYHITLNFLGEMADEQIDVLKKMLDEVSHHHAFFHLKLHGLGVFPSVKEGRVVWMGVQNSLALRALQEDCETRLLDLGFQIEVRPYVPHLTLARLRSPRQLSDVISPLVNHRFGELEIKSLKLYESKLRGPFPVYEPLFHFYLRNRLESTESLNQKSVE
jgi:2'-5' RNA ligase